MNWLVMTMLIAYLFSFFFFFQGSYWAIDTNASNNSAEESYKQSTNQSKIRNKNDRVC